MKRIIAQKIASATKNVSISPDLRIQEDNLVAEEGFIIAGRIRGHKGTYNTLEDRNGRFVSLHDGDIVVGVLGHRDALRGYSGYVPDSIAAGDTLQLLNLGGVIGKCASHNPEIGRPFDVEVLGHVLVFPEFQNRQGVPAHVKMNAVSAPTSLSMQQRVPIVYVAGTCMHSGKTSAASQIIRHLRQKGLEVGGLKLTGVSLLRDTMEMMDHGASWALSFVDAGIVTTEPATAVETARELVSALISKGPDVIVAELGDGIMGRYGVRELLADQPLMALRKALVLCANDPVGAWGSVKFLEESLNLNVDIVSGPTTDNAVGTQYIEEEFGIPALNAMSDGAALGEVVYQLVCDD